MGIVLAPPEVSIVSDKEDLDKNNLTEGETDLPDAPGEMVLRDSTLETVFAAEK